MNRMPQSDKSLNPCKDFLTIVWTTSKIEKRVWKQIKQECPLPDEPHQDKS